ncbi:ABC transporter substrate-binding protein [Saxibacter everestensis]|uniref:ABC transporter substrate-binding protein n=1 Tax=Saxibacter everestensis TaxID=2909229 RepID=A0ABY8QRQ2_9MICO|nr:ABC transporter substrate-binding protein [Brevibacteriaceae bacterium ZFBP1038]
MKIHSKSQNGVRPGAATNRRTFGLSAACLVMLLITAGCSPGGNSGAGGGPVDIHFSTGGALPPNEQEAAIFNGELEDKGVVKGNGEDYRLEMTFAKGTPEAQSLLVAGEVEFATLAFSTIASAQQQNAVPDGFSIVAGHFIDGYPGKFSNTYLVKEDSGIDSVKDLKGKNIGVNSVGTAVDVIFRNALIKAGLDPESDVRFVEIGFGAMGQALRDGRIDVGSMVQPFSEQEMQEGGVKVLTTAKESVGENSAIAVVARNDFLKENPEAAKSFLADWVSGIKWLDDPANRDEAMKIISDVSKTPVDVLDLFYGTEKDYYRNPDACPSATALQAGVDAMVKVGYLENTVDMKSLVDTSYLPDPDACT